MSTPINWNSPDSRLVNVRLSSRWHEVRRGFLVVVLGYVVLLALALPSVLLLRLSLSPQPLFHPDLHFSDKARDALFLPALVATGVTVLLGYGLIVAGKGRCLAYSPQYRGTKELMFTCITAFTAGVVLIGAAHFFGGNRNYVLFEEGFAALQYLSLLSAGSVFQLTGVALLLTGSLLFCQFLRNVALYFNDPDRARNVERYVLFACLLLGGSIGVFLCNPQVLARTAVFVVVAGSWLVFVLWQLFLLLSAGQCIQDGMRKPRADSAPPPAPKDPEELAPKPASDAQGLYETLFSKAEEQPK